MGLFHSLAGLVQVRIIGADISGSLSKITQQDIPVLHLEETDDLTVTCTIFRADYRRVKEIITNRGDNIEITQRQGLYWGAKSLFHRPVLLAGMLIFLFLSLYLPTKILFVRVEGNHAIPTNLILNQAESCGIRFGASRRQVRSEKIKNALVERIPQLQWVGVNTYGCVATIRVTEKSVVAQQSDIRSPISSIVAARDGVITQCTVVKGNSLCKVGQAVKAGQTLISGYTDCGILIKATRSEGEIYARTNREIQVVSPYADKQRGERIETTKKYSLIIGKNVLKLFNNTGISGTDCVKMYEERYMTLPGGFQLPFGIVKEIWVYHESYDPQVPTMESYAWLESCGDSYLKSQMVAGSILNKDTTVVLEDGACRLQGQYACLEMIGQVKDEELIQK